MTKKDAIGGVIAAAAADAAPAEADQLDMLMPPTRTTLTAKERDRVEASVKADRRGRPKGAQNVATRQMLEFVRKLCGDPLERRFRYAMHTPESLSIELGCTKLEAFDRLDKMWSELARYFYAQQASVDGQGNAVVPRLTMLIGGQSATVTGPDGQVRPPWTYIDHADHQTEQNQQVSASAPAVSDGGASSEGEE